MPTWVVTAVISVVLALINLGAQFFFNLVPDIEDRKRYLKQGGSWAFDILTLGGQVFSLYLLTKHNGPVTPNFVVGAALSAGCLVLCLILFGFRRWILDGLIRGILDDLFRLSDNTGQHLDYTGRLIDFTGRHIAITEQLSEALRLLASDPNLANETIQALRTILDGVDGRI
jgi:hypothetical protein